jgi:hypothetical protein
VKIGSEKAGNLDQLPTLIKKAGRCKGYKVAAKIDDSRTARWKQVQEDDDKEKPKALLYESYRD